GLQRAQRLHRHAAHDSTTRGERGLGYNPAHGLSADGAAGADPQGGGDPRAVLLARLLAGEGPKGGVPGGLDPSLRAGRLARDDHPGRIRRPGPGRDPGRKVWNTNAQHATHILLLARTAPRDAARPFADMTLFFTEFDRAKITVREIEKLGRAAVDSNEIFIDGLEIPAANVVGEVGRGFYHLLDSLNPERIFTGIEAVGIGRAALDRAVQYAKERVVFDRPIGQNQAIAHPLGPAWAKLETAGLMCLKAAWLFDNGRPCGAESNTAKLMAAA